MKRRDWQEAPDEQWRALLVDGIGAGFRLVGHAPSRKNPNLCVACLEHTPPGGAEVDTAVLFADVRGSTRIGGAFVGKVGEERGVSDSPPSATRSTSRRGSSRWPGAASWWSARTWTTGSTSCCPVPSGWPWS